MWWLFIDLGEAEGAPPVLTALAPGWLLLVAPHTEFYYIPPI